MSAAYTGPERRWMKSREWSDWTRRSEHHHNQLALKEARDLAILEKLHARAGRAGRSEEYDALWSAAYALKAKLADRRKRIAEEVAPWFDGSVFAEGLTLFQCKLDKSACDHEWNNEGCNPTACLKCGQSFTAYAFMEAP